MKFLYPINLTKNEIQNAVFQNLATAPASPKKGQVYFDSAENDLKVYDGNQWTSTMAAGTSINNRVGSLTLAAGNKLSLLENPNGTFTFSHDTTTVSDLAASGRRYVTGLTFDDYGHVTGFTTAAETVVNTDTTYTAGTGLELDGTTFNNTAPDQEVVLNAGSNVSISGTYPNFTINSSFTDTNTTYTAGTKLSLSGTVFNHEELALAFSTQADTSTTLSGIQFLSNLTVDSSGHISSGKFRKLVSGTNVSITPSTNGNITISSTDTNTTYTAGSNLELVGTTFNNTAPDQEVVLTEGSNVTITGTYPNFTISSTDTNTTYTAGTKLTLDGTIFNHDSTNRTDTTDTGSSGFGGTISVVDSVSTDSTGHLTAINTKTITLPSETQLSLNVTGSGNFVSAQSVSNHGISLTKTNTTEDKITVGELLVSNSGTGTGNVVIQGNLTVEGNTTTISTSELKVEDNVITLNSGATTAALNAGIEVNRGTDPNYEIAFVEATEDFRIGQTGDLQPVLTRDEISGFTNLDLLTWDSTNQRAVGKTPSELGITRKYTTNQAIATDTNYTITHNLGTTDISVSLKDSTTGEFIFADIKTIDNNSIEIGFGEINSVTSVRVIVIG